MEFIANFLAFTAEFPAPHKTQS